MTKGGFITGTSRVCRLCVRYESASNWSAGVAIFVFMALFVAGVFVYILYTHTYIFLIFAVILAPTIFLLLRRELRGKAERELGVS